MARSQIQEGIAALVAARRRTDYMQESVTDGDAVGAASSTQDHVNAVERLLELKELLDVEDTRSPPRLEQLHQARGDSRGTVRFADALGRE